MVEKKHKVKIDDDQEAMVPSGAEEEAPLTDEEIEAEKAAVDRLSADIAAMQGELEHLRQDAEESRDRYLRALADLDNFRKRQRDETARQVNVARENIILKMLPIVDNFQRALQAAEAQHSYESLVEGVSLTMRQIMEMLEKEGVKPIEAIGQEFNPELHEAMMRCEADECPENTIVDEFEKGYTIDGRVLRPSRVKVAISE